MVLFNKKGESIEVYKLTPKTDEIECFRKNQISNLNLSKSVFCAICCDENTEVLDGNEIVFYNTLVHPGKFSGCWHHDFKNYTPNEDEVGKIVEKLKKTVKDYREVKAVINEEVETVKYLFLLKPKYVEQAMEIFRMSMIVEVSKEFYMLNKLLNSQDVSSVDITQITPDILKFFELELKEKETFTQSVYKDIDEELLSKSQIVFDMFNT